MKHQKGKYYGGSALLAATFIYGFFGILSRLIGYELPLFYQTGLRSVVAAALLALFIFWAKKWVNLTKNSLKWIIIRSIFGVIAIVAFFVAVNSLSIATVYFIFYAGSTIGGYIIGHLLFKEKITALKILSLILSMIGLYMIYSLLVDQNKIYYLVISLVSGLSTAAWNTFSKKIPENYPATQLSMLDSVLGAVLALIISLVIKEHWVIPSATIPWGVNFIYGCLYIATGQLVIYGFRKLDAQIGSLIMLTEVIFGVIMGFIFYGEMVSITAIAGGLLIIGAIILPEIISSHFKAKI